MSKIIPFEYGEKEIRVLKDEVSGQPLWVARDVCDALALAHITNALEKLDDDEKLTVKILQSGQRRNMVVVNESGLYTLILRSNKPEAKTFKRWITHEVLPAIRETGSYSVQSAPAALDITPLFSLMEAQTKLMQNTLDSMAMMVADIKEENRSIHKEIESIRSNVGNRLVNAQERKYIYDMIQTKGIYLARVHDVDPSVAIAAIFSKLKSRFKISHYTELQSDDVPEALHFIEFATIS